MVFAPDNTIDNSSIKSVESAFSIAESTDDLRSAVKCDRRSSSRFLVGRYEDLLVGDPRLSTFVGDDSIALTSDTKLSTASSSSSSFPPICFNERCLGKMRDKDDFFLILFSLSWKEIVFFFFSTDLLQ